ncbi:MAG TPA: glycosyltransferase family 1 protein [Cyclobacteriaceae bacterium]|nr:glycosyltransferase family 1 protein [Cyclobacteriaceae bacterium]
MAPKKKILIDIFYLHVAQTGIKTYIESLCDLVENNKTADLEFVVTPDRKKISSSTFFKGKTRFWKNLLFQSVYFFRKLFVLPLLSHMHKTDAVFSPDILSPIWARGKKVSVIHDAFFWENPSHYNAVWLKVYLTFLKAGLQKNAYVLTVSEHSKQQIKKFIEIPDLQIEVVYPSSNLTRKEASIGQHALIRQPYFLHVGVMEKRKNLTTLVQAFAELVQDPEFSDYKLVLVGQPGPRRPLDDHANILAFIEQHQLQGKLVLPGYVSKEALDNYYQHALAYVFPSLNEGFGMPILEAFSYGLPVIVSDQGTLVEVGGSAVLKVTENTPQGFKVAMELVAKDKQLSAEMAQRGYQRLQEFSSSDFYLSLQRTFRKILHE